MLLTFHDGKPDVKEQLSIEAKVKNKWGGTGQAGSVMIAFVDGAAGEVAPTVTPVESNDVDKKYENSSNESTDKILISHRVTSPLLLGIKDATGLGGSNADELIASYKLFNSTVIAPFQEILIDGLQQILEFNGTNVDLFFTPLMPIDFIESTNKVDEDVLEKETGIDVDSEYNVVMEDKKV